MTRSSPDGGQTAVALEETAADTGVGERGGDDDDDGGPPAAARTTAVGDSVTPATDEHGGTSASSPGTSRQPSPAQRHSLPSLPHPASAATTPLVVVVTSLDFTSDPSTSSSSNRQCLPSSSIY